MSGALLLLATLVLALKGGAVVGPTLGLLEQYLPGYRVTLTGGLLGGFYGGPSGSWAAGPSRSSATFLPLVPS